MFKILPFSLQLFAYGADAGGDNGASAEAIGNAEEASENTKVVYGKVNEVTEESNQAEPEEENAEKNEIPEESFDDLIKGKYKDDFSKKVKSILDRRFQNVRKMESTIAKQSEVLEELYNRYEVDNPDSLLQKVLNDEAYWEQLAEKEGMTIPQIKEVERIKRDNQKIMKEAELYRNSLEAQKQAEKWASEGTEVQKIYPSFDLFSELENNDFKELIRNGVPMKKAYEVIHLDALASGVAKASAQDASRKTAERIKARGLRPNENIGASSSGVIVKSDPSKFTKADFKEIRRLAERGEIIGF